ncbi:hypothetical protein KsCSTR_09560 [Candidatus Kuenenia stuttgartiensis]|uniref:Uncharacterized protein n=1 Tax=Kuenenia stuttgartiensis TaxID=174633 RepID=Q1PYZ8_KUEST|nr:hypothetical protein KsCSTR_09560 [Candidatus Kuenenia stuttgartiensis]CAJ72300.1 unknown protein [Candidatus Kuenenia stuttgartiensis]
MALLFFLDFIEFSYSISILLSRFRGRNLRGDFFYRLSMDRPHNDKAISLCGFFCFSTCDI